MGSEGMEAGPEMDRLVAEKVMGWAINPNPDKYRPHSINKYGQPVLEVVNIGSGFDAYEELIFRPSESIAHAWEVVEKLRLMVFPCKDGWAAAIPYDADGEGPAHGEHWIDDSLSHYAEADTAPLAICRCALMAMEKKG